MSLQARVEEHADRLSAADERIVRELLTDPAEAAFLSAAELADRAGVHEASAVRLAQKLGYRGYPQLRADLRSDLLSRSDPGERVRRRLAHADGGVLASVVQDEVAALASLPERLGQEQLDAAARVLIDARVVHLFAQGHATSLVELLDRRLRRSGSATSVVTGRSRDLAERAQTLRSDDAVVAFAFVQRPHGLSPLLEHAREVGARSVLVSDTLGPLIRPVPDVVLAAPRGAEGEFQSLTVPMAICNALVLTVARLDEGRSLAALDRLTGLIRRFDDEER
jgi:DNA-binding MurR/RpiR family transcriptional regulator